MNETQSKKILNDIYESIKKDGAELSEEDLEIAIEAMYLARNEIKKLEQDKIKKTNKKTNKKSSLPDKNQGKVLKIAKGIKTLSSNAFRGNKEITKVILNDELTQIGEYAFEGCTNLREVIFPNKKIILRKGCFMGCTSLEHVFIPEVSNICPAAFEDCTALLTVSLPSNISTIYSKAFKNCCSLHTVTFEEKSWFSWQYTNIYGNVFENCVSLKKIELPKKCGVDVRAFVNCQNLKEIYIKDTWTYKRKFEKCNARIIEK